MSVFELTNNDLECIKNELSYLDDPNLLSKTRPLNRGKYLYENPNKDKALIMIKDFLDASNKGGYDSSVIDICKIFMLGSYEHFIRVRFGWSTHYLSEIGLNKVYSLMMDKANVGVIRKELGQHNINATAGFKKRLLTRFPHLKGRSLVEACLILES